MGVGSVGSNLYQVGRCKTQVAPGGVPEKDLNIDKGLPQLGFFLFVLLQLGDKLGAALAVFVLDVEPSYPSSMLDGLGKGEPQVIHQESHTVASCAAAKTLEDSFGFGYGKAGAFLLVKWAASDMVDAGPLQLYVLSDDVKYRDFVPNLVSILYHAVVFYEVGKNESLSSAAYTGGREYAAE